MRTKSTLGEESAKDAYLASRLALEHHKDSSRAVQHLVSEHHLQGQAFIIWALSSQLLVKYAELELLQSLREGRP